MVARIENLDQTMVNTAASRESLGHTVRDDTAANCLMLLTRVGQCSGGRGQSRRVFRCKTCMQFSSFQALGGHRSSSSDEQSPSLSSGSFTKKKAKKTRPHRCPICGLEFSMGQALGGRHMTKHRNKEDSGGALVTRSFFPEAATTTMFTTLKKPSSGKRAACLDLGSGSMEAMINLKLELGRTFS